MKLSEQVKPISYLKAHASEVVNGICENHKPVVITQNGEARAILLDLETHEKFQESMAMLKILAQSQQSKEKGNYRSASKVFADLKKSVQSK